MKRLIEKKDKADTELKVTCDLELIRRIQPIGNIQLKDDKYIATGDGYVSCIQVYEFPGQVYDFWLSTLTNMENVFTVVDIATEENEAAQNDIVSSLNELDVRFSRAQDDGTRIEAEQKYDLLKDMLSSIKTQGEIIKLLQVRIYVAGRTKSEVDERTAEIIKFLESDEYRCAVFLNETEYQYKALINPYKKQKKELNKRIGNPLPSQSLAGGYPFNFEQLDDPYGMYIGQSETSGNIIFDVFHKSKERLSYDTLVIGKKGSGKSTLLKLLLKNNAIIGNFIRVIDVSGEFTDLALSLGGKIVTLNGKDGIINYLEVFKTDEEEAISFANHLSKLNTFYKYVAENSDEDDRNEFEEYVRRLYEINGLWIPGATTEQKITGLAPTLYPIFDDLLTLIRSDLYDDYQTRQVNRNLSPSKWKRLESMELTISNLVNSYGHMFNGHTSLPNLTEEQIVVYNVESIGNIKDGVFNSALFNVLSLMLDDMVRVGAESKRKYEEGASICDLTKLLLIIDEAHRFVNTRNTLALDYTVNIMREGRKYFTGLILASQSIRDFAPHNNDSEAVEKLKTLFELTQYKFIMQQESNCLNLLRSIFEDSLTESQFKQIPKCSQGEAFLLTGAECLHTYITITEEERRLFKGGA